MIDKLPKMAGTRQPQKSADFSICSEDGSPDAVVGEVLKLCHHWPMRYLLLIALALAFVGGCSSNPTPEVETAADSAAPASPAAPVEASSEAVASPERAFPDDSLYPLLVAEFALRRRRYDVALENYLEQAERLRDRGISAQTARLAQFMHRDQEAISASELWVELDPDNLEARLTLANLLARHGRSRDALPHMESILRAGGIANFTALVRGFEDLGTAEQAEFIAKIEALQAEYPKNIQLRICQVLMLEEMGQIETAVAQLQTVFEIDPGQPQAVVLDAKLRQDLGQRDGIYRRIVAALEEQPDNDRLRMQYARLLTRTDMSEAERQFKLLLEHSPDDPDLLFSIALIQREIEDLEGARESLERLLATSTRTDEAHYYLGKTAEEQGRWEDALVHYMQVQPGRDFAAATGRLAQLMIASGETAELGTYFDHLRERFPQLGEQLYAVEAEKLSSGNHLAEAMQLLNRALEEFPDSTSLQYSRSMLSEQLGNMLLAEQDLRKILEREPDNATALNALGYILANRTNRYEEAEALIARALSINPDEPAILDSMGWVNYHLGNYEVALDYLQQAYQAFPDPEVAAHLGEVLWVVGDSEAALAVWNQALAKSPDHQILLETIQRLGVNLADQ